MKDEKDMKELAIKTEALSKTYDMGNNQIEALRKTDLEITRGSFVSLTGTSGSGKSTLLHLLGGLDAPTTGEVWIEGQSLSKCKEKQLAEIRRDRIGFVFQKFHLIQELSVRENIIMPVLLASRKVNEAYIEEICEVLGLTDRMEHMPHELSGGQQQRTAIARALANEAAILLCDEPTGNLDKKTSEEVIHLLHDIHKKYNKTILIVTHDLEIAESAEYMLRIEDGRILG